VTRAILARVGCKVIRRYPGTGSRQPRVYEALMRALWSWPEPIRLIQKRNYILDQYFWTSELGWYCVNIRNCWIFCG